MYHPRGPQDVPLEVEDWLEPVAACLDSLNAEARARRGVPW